MNQREVTQLVQVIRTLWPSVPWHADPNLVVELWPVVLADVSRDEAVTVLREHAARGEQFPPAPGVLLHMVLNARDRAAGVAAPDPDEAWREVADAIATLGWHGGPPAWSHPCIAEAARTIGWNDLCHAENQSVVRGQYRRAYADVVQRSVDERRRAENHAALAALRGVHAGQDKALGPVTPAE